MLTTHTQSEMLQDSLIKDNKKEAILVKTFKYTPGGDD